MKTILLTNDDGFFSPGIARLHDRLSGSHEVYVVAPDSERSAISMALTLNRPLRVNRMAERVFAVNGTPCDCVNIALQKILPRRPDFIISGMNLGENLSEDVFFSGTVGGAFAGYLYGLPALAVSLIAGLGDFSIREFDFSQGAEVVAGVLEKLLTLPFADIVYNLNIPLPHSGRIVVTTLGRKRYKPDIVERTDPRGRLYYWIGTGKPDYQVHPGSDIQAVRNGDVSLSALSYELDADAGRERLAALFP
jgi:5'-nucleotidase